MVEKKVSKRQRDIKTKLMAAIAMLLVSSIMMVSTTYAWFTLSTAPEVTGITTAVGANGNLEMALQPLHGDSSKITSGEGNSMDVQFAFLANTTWGNLVDVSDNSSYGMNKIMLYPAKLNAENGVIGERPLATPEYGSDGRVANLATKTLTGVFDGEKFSESISYEGTTISSPYGVRAIGTSSSMSDRQLAYRSALSTANTAAGQAKQSASQSLSTNGANLADIAIKHVTTPDELFTTTELGYLENIVNVLLAEDGSLKHIEKALSQYALAVVLSGISDDNYAGAVSAFNKANRTTLKGVMESYNMDEEYASVYTAIVSDLDTLSATITKVEEAQATLQNLLYQKDDNGFILDNEGKKTPVDAGTKYEWKTFSSALTLLANPDSMEINKIQVGDLTGKWKYNEAIDGKLPAGYTTNTDGYVLDEEGEIVSNMARLVDAVLNDGLQLIIRSGAGVYADIADFSGDYSASVTLSKVSYGGMTVKNLDATMKTATNQNPTYLAAITVPPFNNGAGGSASNAISDFYGYILDLAFRTNVAGSNLQLQQTAVDRIYEGNTANAQTMGHGASMTFKSTVDTFSGAQVKSLMACIRIVFFNSDDRTIIGYAKLDPNSAVEDNGNITMTIVMTDDKGAILTDNKTIMALEQNTVHELSVMVYLDGAKVENKDVANGASSMTGTMNLQFSSSAPLTPMEYTDLRTGTNAGAERIMLKNVSGVGVTIGAAACEGTNVVIQLKGVNVGETVTVDINGATQTATVQPYNSFTGIQVEASNVTADTPIVVTYNAPAQGGGEQTG